MNLAYYCCIACIFSLSYGASSASALDLDAPYGSSGNYLDASFPHSWTSLPDDLHLPPEFAAGRSGVSGSFGGIFIAPNWTLGASHQSQWQPDQTVFIEVPKLTTPQPWDREELAVKVEERVEIGDTLLYKFKNTDGSPLSVPYIPLRQNALPPVTKFTHASSGHTNGLDGLLALGSEELRFNRGIADYTTLEGNFYRASPASNHSALGVVDDFTLLYPGSHGIGGDSGSSFLYRDGLNWFVVGQSGTGGLGGLGNKLDDGDLAVIQGVLGADYPAVASPAAVPSANDTWSTGSPSSPAPAPASSGFDRVVSITGSTLLANTTIQGKDFLLGQGGGNWAYLTLQSGGTLETSGGLFVAPDSGDNGALFMQGGKVTANQVVLGLSGTAGVIQSGGVIEALTSVKVAKHAGSAATFFLNDTSGAAEIITNWLVIGEEAGASGQLNQEGNTQVLTRRTTVGDAGTGVYRQYAGSHITEELRVGASSTYELLGGTLDIETGEIEGTAVLRSGSINAGSTLKAANLDFGGVVSAPSLTGNFDFRDATISGASNAAIAVDGFMDLSGASLLSSNGMQLSVGSEGLLVVSPSIAAAEAASQISIATVDQPYAIAGQPIVVNSHTVSVNGDILEFVDVSTGGAVVSRGGKPIHYRKGLQWTGGGSVGFGEEGSLTVTANDDAPSLIHPVAVIYEMPNLEVQPGGSLTASGVTASLPNTNQVILGELIIGPGEATLSLNDSILWFNQTIDRATISPAEDNVASLVMDISNSGSDKLVVDSAFINGGTLELHVDAGTSSSPYNGEAYEIISAAGTLGRWFTITGQPYFDGVNVISPGNSGTGIIVDTDGVHDLDGTDVAMVVRMPGDTLANDSTVVATSIFVQVALPGDANLDGSVDLLDQDIQGMHFGTAGGWDEGDFNGDGYVDLLDLDILGSYWGATWSGGGTSIPEPGSVALGALAAISSVCRRRPTDRAN